MKCPSCGAEIAENVVICHSCGTRLEPPAGARPEAATAAAKPSRPAEPKGPAAAADADRSACPPPWRYSSRDMRIVWINMCLLTLAFVAVGVWLRTTREHWPGWLSPAVFWGIVLGIPGVLWLYQLSKLIYRTTIRYDLDESRLIHKEGIFVSKTSVIELIRIDDMDATQSLVERFICGGIGKVHIHSEDPTDPHLVLRGLENHDAVFRQIDTRRAEARRKKAFVHA
jgi:uncharacterized membrane protein YdbT with pleckstrin-like domain